MLKALELFGFKSFADKTRFEFPAGITVVVGPNGSGKSNVVDAIKWVLGEQSAKSLRGQDMADVIFKGSGSGGRKALNAAEATIVFENADGRLPVDAPEVHVTRRVYRSGEGEYLINRQPCRLKDIKDLFRGTGVGVDAYSIIEQGKVDRLLQASPKDRRAMFEEAAGISRFKAKKVEAQRRLERVDQNLLRLNDIVEEVENRLKSVRAQASKAKRYREYTQRLQELRTQVGLTDWRRLTDQINERERECQRLRDEGASIQTRAELLEARILEVDTELAGFSDALREQEAKVARCREQIVGMESQTDQHRARANDLQEEIAKHRRHLAALCSRAGDLQGRRRDIVSQLARARGAHAAVSAQLIEQERQLASLAATLDAARSQLEAHRAEHVVQLRRAATLSNETSGHRSQLAVLAETAQRCRGRIEELDQLLAVQTVELEQARVAEASVQQETDAKLNLLEASQREVAENRRVQARRQQEIAEMSGVLTGVRERAGMLDDWENRREGVGSGVKEVLALARQPQSSALAEVRGLVADVLQASVELAPLVDIALGEAAQHVIIDGARLLDEIAMATFRPSARVGFVRLAAPPGYVPPLAKEQGLELQPGVIGRADFVVETGAEYSSLMHRLLGDTWFVDDLHTALRLQATAGRGLRFVTRAGQLLERDGTIIAGARHATIGLVSRRSELRDLKQRIAILETRITEGQREVARLQENIDQQDQRVRVLAEEYQKLSTSLTEHHVRTRTLAQQFEQRTEQRAAISIEWDDTQRQHASVSEQLDLACAQLAGVEAALEVLEQRIAAAETETQAVDERRQEAARLHTTTKIELAKCEQRLDSLEAQLAQFERDERERNEAVQVARQQLQEGVTRAENADRQILRSTSELAALYLRKQELVREAVVHLARRDELSSQRGKLADELNSGRRQARQLEEQLHEQELAANAVRHERNTLVERIREDYSVDLTSSDGPMTGEEIQQREQVEEEIANLRKKINSIGAVNMDALAELDDLESRFATLSGQFQDLKNAKESLERIIQKINADSRRLFLETLEKIRTNFQTLYRRAFGGGRADIVLEEGADVLECGVDIVATPPGKPSFSNSLLSGGEKALTAVALLLAIFQFRPSPFCVLDEVDAPFDEANIGRFIDVLKDFLSFTKFIIVTHSKKTMTSANTLYGVTMQESGVSKRVSVQFDDVSEDGEISKAAVERQSRSEKENQSQDKAA